MKKEKDYLAALSLASLKTIVPLGRLSMTIESIQQTGHFGNEITKTMPN